MTAFRLKIPLKKEKNQIKYNSDILMLGSCFSENIAQKLTYFKYNVTVNPFGIMFHPKAISDFIDNVLNLKVYNENDIFFHNEQWHCFEAHSKLSSVSKVDLLETLNETITQTHQQIKKCSHIIITLGTSWVYHHLKSNKTVANCHKVPQKEFNKEILTVEEIKKNLIKITDLLNKINSKATVIYTVSPVRHVKDGFIENQLSKAHLITAIHQILSKNTYYFPSYEIVMDELRDYRFYKDDMLHPNNTAINYIWERFTESWLDENEKSTRKIIETIQKGLEHRPFNENTENHQLFLKKLHLRISKLQEDCPNIIF